MTVSKDNAQGNGRWWVENSFHLLTCVGLIPNLRLNAVEK